MTNRQMKLPLIAGFIALIATFFVLRLRLNDGLLTDTFHYGEYFAVLSSIIGQVDFVPLTIHGALDYVPGLLAIWIAGKGGYLFLTLLLYLLLSFLGCLILYGLVSYSSKSAAQIVTAGFLIPFVVDYRDFTLLALVLAYFVAVKARENCYKPILLIILGFVGACNFFYSTNRGIAGTVSFGFPLLILSLYSRQYLLAIISFIFFAILISLISPIVGLHNYFENILILAKTSYQWGYGFQLEAVLLSAFLFVFLFLATCLNLLRANQMRISGSFKNPELANLSLVLLLSIFYFQIGSYRADFQHVSMGLLAFVFSISYWNYLSPLTLKNSELEKIVLWILFLMTPLISIYDVLLSFVLLAYVGNILFEKNVFRISTSLNKRFNFDVVACSILLCAVAFMLIRGTSQGSYKWIQDFSGPIDNKQSVTKPMIWVSDVLIKNHANCVFDLTNSGVINALGGIPACSRFSYLVYADRKFEPELINALIATHPPVIVYSAKNWFYAIDGKSMKQRYPELDEYIQRTYPHEECEFEYCVRYKN